MLDEFESYLKKLNANKIRLDNNLATKGCRKVNPYKNNKKFSKRRFLVKPSDTRKIISQRNGKNQGFIARYVRLIDALYINLQNEVISYKELPENQDFFYGLEEKILKFQEGIDLPDNEKIRGTAEKLITTALILGKYTTVNLFTSSTRIFDTMFELSSKDFGVYSAQELKSLKEKPAVRTISFDAKFMKFYEVEFPGSVKNIVYPVHNLPKRIPTDKEKHSRPASDFSRFA